MNTKRERVVYTESTSEHYTLAIAAHRDSSAVHGDVSGSIWRSTSSERRAAFSSGVVSSSTGSGEAGKGTSTAALASEALTPSSFGRGVV